MILALLIHNDHNDNLDRQFFVLITTCLYIFKGKTLLHQLFKSSLLFCVFSLFSIVLVFFLDLIVPAAAAARK